MHACNCEKNIISLSILSVFLVYLFGKRYVGRYAEIWAWSEAEALRPFRR
jgi:hypothetical protein